MTAQTILASNRAVTIVLEVRTDNTKVLPASYSDWVGGPSMLAYPLGVDFEDNSLLYLSTGAVAGLAYNEVVFSDFFVERSLAAPFTGGGGLSINGLPNAPSFAGLDIFVSGDDLELYARDWENKPFTLYVGYEGDDWANFEVYFTGKTIGHSLINDGIQVDLSLNPTGTDKLFPVNRFADGRVKPYIFGAVKNIRPVKVNPDNDDGLWMFTSGSVVTTDFEFEKPPAVEYDGKNDFAYGRIAYWAFSSSGFSLTGDEHGLPADVTLGDVSIAEDGDHIKITAPDNTGVSDYTGGVYAVTEVNDAGSESVDYDVYFDFSLDTSSTLDEYDILVGFSPFIGIDNPTKATKAIKTVRLSNSSVLPSAWIQVKKANGDDAEDIILNVYGIRIVPKVTTPSLVVLGRESSSFFKIPTYRVVDANITASLPSFIAVYDDTGLLKIADDNNDFIIKRVTGDATNNDLVAACQYISTQANGTDSPITSSITSPTVGIYCDKAKPIVEWWREWCDSTDVYLDVSLTTSTTDLKRRFNNQVFDADGVLNVTESFSFTEDDIINLKQLPNEPSVSQYEVSYNQKYELPNESPTVTSINPFARLNQVKRIDTVLKTQADATVVAELNNRDGNRRTFYEFEVAGAGHGLSPNDTGFISHSKIKDGKFTLRFIREYPLQKKTLLKGVKNG